jgi:CRISPR system Cascade subunit CasD
MQSWGVESRHTVRDTAREPSKSGIVGLLCAALGRPRQKPVDDLGRLVMGVRVEQEGLMSVDYQTAGGTTQGRVRYGVATVDGGLTTVVSRRYYLANADFLVGLQGELELLEELEESLKHPRWHLYLGRKGYVPSLPVLHPNGLKPDIALEDALKTEPWPLPFNSERRAAEPEPVRVVVEVAGPEEADRFQYDQPLGAAFTTRSFGIRYVRTFYWQPGRDIPIREG